MAKSGSKLEQVYLSFQHQRDSVTEFYSEFCLSTASESKLTSRGGRALLWSWWMLSLVVMSAYSGTLTSFLSANQQRQLFSTPEDLLSGSHGYTWGAMKDSNLVEILKVTEACRTSFAVCITFRGPYLASSFSCEIWTSTMVLHGHACSL